ncbi:hypothetical protein BKA57DRAFT_50280 [Linnemannia elongata]|nr:hypothetical protein BKA57DRAFT_50280 [Linnemannia elongata]
MYTLLSCSWLSFPPSFAIISYAFPLPSPKIFSSLSTRSMRHIGRQLHLGVLFLHSTLALYFYPLQVCSFRLFVSSLPTCTS